MLKEAIKIKMRNPLRVLRTVLMWPFHRTPIRQRYGVIDTRKRLKRLGVKSTTTYDQNGHAVITCENPYAELPKS